MSSYRRLQIRFCSCDRSPSTPISCPGTASSDEELRTAHKLPESNRSSARLHWQNTAQSAARSSLCSRRGTGAARERGSRPIFRQQLNKVKALHRAAKNDAQAEIAKFPGKNDIFTLCDSLAQRLPKRESRAMLLALHSLGSSSPRPSPDGTGTAGREWSRTCFGMIPGKRLRSSGRPFQNRYSRRCSLAAQRTPICKQLESRGAICTRRRAAGVSPPVLG